MEEQKQEQQPPANQISKKQAMKNWMQFETSEDLAETLVANKFMQPTEVQAQSLVFLNQHIDMVIAAKTGQGKTLCFGIPVLDLLIRRLERQQDEEVLTEQVKLRTLIMTPTRELALQIKDHLQAVVPVAYQDKIQVCPLVGGMSVQKQERLLSYQPAIIVATPGRLWELIDSNAYLQSQLPLIDVLVLDEADRMIEDGHFKEMQQILDFIYSKRVEFKKLKILKSQQKDNQEQNELKTAILQMAKKKPKKSDFTIKPLEQAQGVKIDFSNIVDLYDEDQMLEEIDANNLILVDEEKQKGKEEEAKGKQKKNKRQTQQQIQQEQEEKFAKEYKKMGGIQHIICSATLTIDSSGRITPKKAKKKAKMDKKQQQQNTNSTLEQLCKTLRFRSKNPKVIDLTEEERMPETLKESAIRCEQNEKDLYTYYFIRQKSGESTIIFSNSITCTKRVSNLLTFLKIKNYCLHSKMQQRQRIKNLDRFKAQVQACEAGTSNEGAVLVCTDVAARGLDIPYVQNVLHYQCPFNAEIYIHRCGRTARIFRSGESLALLAAEDEKNYKIIRKVLKKDSQPEMYQVSYAQLAKLEPLLESAQKIEQALHQQRREDKTQSWVMKLAKEADLAIEEPQDTQGQSKRKKKAEQKAIVDIFNAKDYQGGDDEENSRTQKTQLTKVQLMKKRYEELKNEELTKKISNSSFLTPEAASYLNELIKKGQTRHVDQEIVFAGQHHIEGPEKKFKRKEKYTARYKNRTKKRRKH